MSNSSETTLKPFHHFEWRGVKHAGIENTRHERHLADMWKV